MTQFIKLEELVGTRRDKDGTLFFTRMPVIINTHYIVDVIACDKDNCGGLAKTKITMANNRAAIYTPMEFKEFYEFLEWHSCA